ncbi:MAG TPA: DUF4345 domain-containing protein [Thermoanaerobaculia bacterium]|nr:DUF4345 domain-containing protein [Thermoanaerobaculia bacterium]
MARTILLIGSLLFIAIGLAFVVKPVGMASGVEVELPTPTARVDLAATYGGFDLAFGLFLGACWRRPERHRVGLEALGWALAGFGSVRLLWTLLEGGGVSGLLYAFLPIELGGAVLSFWLASKLPRETAG